VLNAKNTYRCKHTLWKHNSSFCVDVMFQNHASFPLLSKAHGKKPSAYHPYINTELYRHALNFSRWNYARETGNCLDFTDSPCDVPTIILSSTTWRVTAINDNKSNSFIPLSALNSIVINKTNRQLTAVSCWALMVLNKVLYVLSLSLHPAFWSLFSFTRQQMHFY
jgi:hypothetical protein